VSSSASRPAISVQAAAAVLSAFRLGLFAASASDLQGFSVAGLDRVIYSSSSAMLNTFDHVTSPM
jgi:hypothetical protein